MRVIEVGIYRCIMSTKEVESKRKKAAENTIRRSNSVSGFEWVFAIKGLNRIKRIKHT
jgi:hypothetical protein